MSYVLLLLDEPVLLLRTLVALHVVFISACGRKLLSPPQSPVHHGKPSSLEQVCFSCLLSTLVATGGGGGGGGGRCCGHCRSVRYRAAVQDN